MSRSTQYIGLNTFANNFLKEHGTVIEETNKICRKNLRTGIVEEKEISFTEMEQGKSKYHAQGMFGEDVPLSSFVLQDGRVVHEKEQCSPWSSGPMVFTYLVWENDEPVEGTSWVYDETTDGEVDYERGTYFV